MKRLVSIGATLGLVFVGLTSLSAAAVDTSCLLGGTLGRGGANLTISSAAELQGMAGCIDSSAPAQQTFTLNNSISLSGNFSPINLDAYGAANKVVFDGNSYSISGLSVDVATSEAGLFGKARNAVVKNLTVYGSSVIGRNYVGGLVGYASNAEILNVKVVYSGDIRGDSASVIGAGQQVGGVVGGADSGTIISDVTYINSGGTVKGADYVGGAVGTIRNSTINKVAVQSDVTATTIAGGIVGEMEINADTSMSQTFYRGTLVGDTYVAGSVGYLWSNGSPNRSFGISNSVVRGYIASRGSINTNAEPKAFVGNIGSGISSTTSENNYSSAIYAQNTNSVITGATHVQTTSGLSAKTNTRNYYDAWATGGTTIDGATLTNLGISEDVIAGAVWTVKQQATYASVSSNENWVVDTTSDTERRMNDGKPMPRSSYNMGFFGPKCSEGTFSATGNVNCDPAPAGRYVATRGATTALLCQPGTFQNQTGQFSCVDAEPGYFVSVAGAVAQVACPPDQTSDARALSCRPITSGGGGGGGVMPTNSVLSNKAKPRIGGEVAKQKALSAIAGSWVSDRPVTETYKWFRCSKPMKSTNRFVSNLACSKIDGATQATYPLGDQDLKSFVVLEVTATDGVGSATYSTASVNANGLKYLVLKNNPKISGTNKVGKVLTLAKPSFTNSQPTKLTRQWYRCSLAFVAAEVLPAGVCKPIPKATGTTYRLTTPDKGKFVTVKIAATYGKWKVSYTPGVSAKTK